MAEPKIASLLDTGAVIKVVAPQARDQVITWAREQRIQWEQRCFQASDIDDCFLVISATNSVHVNETVYREAEARGVLCNAVDDPDRCDFYYPAVVRRGKLQIAISTAGDSPALAQRLRRELEDQFGPEYGHWVEHLGRERVRLRSDHTLSGEDCKRQLHSQASASGYRSFINDKETRSAR